MQPMPNAPEGSEAPLYIRWGPSGSPYAIELKLDLVAKIRESAFFGRRYGRDWGGTDWISSQFALAYAPCRRRRNDPEG